MATRVVPLIEARFREKFEVWVEKLRREKQEKEKSGGAGGMGMGTGEDDEEMWNRRYSMPKPYEPK